MRKMTEERFSKKVVRWVILLNTLFVIAVLLIYWHTGSEPAALIASWFAFTTGELWALAGIKRKEIHAGNSGNEHNE